MPESMKVKNRKEKKEIKALESLKAKGKFSKWIQEKLINWIKIIKEVDKLKKK